MKKKYSSTIMNTGMLYLLTAAKMVFPLIILPYLARVLTVDCYGMVAYVKSAVSYAQIIVDFGFILSAVKEVVNAGGDKNKISHIIGDTVVSKLMLSAAAFAIIFVICLNIRILDGNMLYVCLSLLVPVLSCFLMDFLFRGIEKMHMITIIFVLMKTVSTALTMLLVRSDSSVLLIPIFDIISSVVAIIVTWVITIKLGFSFKFTSLKSCFGKIKNSFGYFANSIASTALGIFTTIIMGFFITDGEQIAFWSVCMQLTGAVQNMYTPISNGIYPYMIKSRDLKLIRNILLIFMPLVLAGAALCYFLAPLIMTVVAGEAYLGAVPVFRWLFPVMVISFPVAILGWPSLGPIGKVKEISTGTLFAAVTQIAGLFFLALIGKFNILNIAIFRNVPELIMLIFRGGYVYKYRALYDKNKTTEE